MTKEEFINEIERITDLYLDDNTEVPKLKKLYDKIVEQSIAEHEAKQWRKYQDNVPGKSWICYEIHRPNIPDNGCKTQCEECKEKQRKEDKP